MGEISEFIVSIFFHFKLELLTQFPASNDIEISQFELMIT